MHLIQYFDANGARAVAVTQNGETRQVQGVTSVYELAQAALSVGGLSAAVAARGLGAAVDKAALLAEGRLLSPIDHPDPTHLHVTGTGLTHLGSAATRDAMHKASGDKPTGELTERINYLFLAHSKLRACSFGPELRVGDLPSHIEGVSRILRDGQVLWEKPFLSGEDNMSHTIANLEYHHFKYGLFCQPGDVHVHCFGTATLSFADGISTKENDVFEIEESQFGLPLRNPVHVEDEKPVVINGLY